MSEGYSPSLNWPEPRASPRIPEQGPVNPCEASEFSFGGTAIQEDIATTQLGDDQNMARRSSDASANDHGQRVKGCEVFVGGLARNISESTIREIFSSCGEIVNVRMMKDQNGTPKGYCFVRFTTKEAAMKAQKKDGYMLQGKKMGVDLSKDQVSLFMGSLRKDWSFEEFDLMVRQAFQDVLSVDLATPLNTGDSALGRKQQNRGFAFVHFSSHAAAARAHRIGTRPDFLLDDKWHPIVDWAESEAELDSEELAKIKVAYVGNLPINVDEEYLKSLFEPFGELERVAVSKKSNPAFGFVHFYKRSDLEKAIEEMDGKSVQGPGKGPKYKLQVSVARPEKGRKRGYDESQSKPAYNQDKYLKETRVYGSSDEYKSKVPRLRNPVEGPSASDPYEEAVVSLPSAVTERLLRIFRLGIATRYDIDIHCITSLRELPESAAVAVLDQYLITGADRPNKGTYLSSLIARHQVDKSGLSHHSSRLPSRGADFPSRESELLGLPGPTHAPAIEHVSSRSTLNAPARYRSYTPSPPRRSSPRRSPPRRSPPRRYPYSSSILDDTLIPPRASLSKLGETSSLYRAPISSSYGGSSRTDSQRSSAIERPPQVKFDPFTGAPYKFDPFTGEPINHDPPPRSSGSLY